jgi:hypothetical protein
MRLPNNASIKIISTFILVFLIGLIGACSNPQSRAAATITQATLNALSTETQRSLNFDAIQTDVAIIADEMTPEAYSRAHSVTAQK